MIQPSSSSPMFDTRYVLIAEISSCAHKGPHRKFDGFIFQPPHRTVTPCKERRSHGVFAKACRAWLFWVCQFNKFSVKVLKIFPKALRRFEIRFSLLEFLTHG